MIEDTTENVWHAAKHLHAIGITLRKLYDEEALDLVAEHFNGAATVEQQQRLYDLITLVRDHLMYQVETEWDRTDQFMYPRGIRFFDEEKYGYSAVATDVLNLLTLLDD